jgi:branched-chain amino acid transport system permease protein
VGGIGTLLGPLLGSIGVPWLTQYLQFLQDYRFVVFGPLLIILVIFVPHGVVGSYLAWRARNASRLATEAAAKQANTQTSAAGVIGRGQQKGSSHA